MLLVVGTFVVVFVILVLKGFAKEEGLFPVAFMSLLAMLVAGLVALGLGMILPNEWKVAQEVNLASLRNTEGTEGRFFLGSGHIQTNMVYYYYIQGEDGGYRPDSVSMKAYEVVIFEEDRSDGNLIIYRRAVTSPFDLVALVFKDYRYDFHIPAGSLLLNYEVK